MSGSIKIEIDDRAIQQAFRQLLDRAGDMSPALREIAGIMADQAEEAFDGEFDPETGESWAPLATSTIAKREKAGNWPGKKLQVTGSLATSVQASQNSGSDFAEIGSNKVYAALMQKGGQAGRNRSVEVPARPFLGITPQGREDILDVVTRYLEP